MQVHKQPKLQASGDVAHRKAVWGDKMKSNHGWYLGILMASAAVLPQAALAQYGGGSDGGAAPPPNTTVANSVPHPEQSPMLDGGYAAVMGTYYKTLSDPELSNAYGGSIFLGYRAGVYALETGLGYVTDSGINREIFRIKALLFPFKSLPMAYAVVGGGMTRMVGYPVQQPAIGISGNKNTYDVDAQAGLGYMFPMHLGRYEFALRAEGLYNLGDRFLQRQSDFDRDIPIPSTFKDVVVNVGLQLPLRFPQPVAPPAPAPVEVVKPTDTDGDGVTDDLDKCPDTPAGTKVDATGCPLPPPPPPCKPPASGEKIDLSGCGTGDVVVLRGVNFEFDKSNLTLNAKAILDDVALALLAESGLHIEIGGHTDSRGSDEYNQKLSDARAQSVMDYLIENGVAADHLSSVGYGESKPVADNATDEGRELNRRVELKILGRDKVPEATSAPEAVAKPQDSMGTGSGNTISLPDSDASAAPSMAPEQAGESATGTAESLPSTESPAHPELAPAQ